MKADSSPAAGRVAGKVALITGGTGGIGRAIALRLGEQGARVVLTDIDGAQAEATLSALAAGGIEAAFHLHDVTRPEHWQRVVAATLERFGRFDVLVNNAGIALPPPESFDLSSYEDWRRIMSVNLDGAFLGMREAVGAMKTRGGGSIVNIGSVAAYVGTPGGAAYGSSKGGLRTLTKQAAVACARRGDPIRINTVHPCYVRTPMSQAGAAKRWGEAGAEEGMRSLHPFRCLGEPDDVAYAVLFLASDESRLMNGADLLIDGGLTAT